MKNLRTVFTIIQKHCASSGDAGEKCLEELEQIAAFNNLFFPLQVYLQILQTLGLIKIYRFRNQIILTQTGESTEASEIPKSKARTLLFLLMIRRVISVSVLLVLFWPARLAIQKQYHPGRNLQSRARTSSADEFY